MPIKNTKNANSSSKFNSVFLLLHENFFYCLAIIALLWIAGLCYYVEYFIGWSSIFVLSPADFSLFLIAVIIPLLFFWFVLAYIDRSICLNENASLFGNYINNLIYPDDRSSQNAKAIALAIKEQVTAFQQETTNALSQSLQIKNDLSERVQELSQILKLLDTYSSKTLIDLNDGVKQLYDRCTYITDKTTNTIYHMQESTSSIAKQGDNFLSKITPVLDEISAISSNIKNNISDNKLYLTEMKKLLEQVSNTTEQSVTDMLAKTEKNTLRIERSFYKMSDEYSSLYKQLDNSVSGIEGRIEDQKRLLSMQTTVINNNSQLLNTNITKHGQQLSLEIDKLSKVSYELEKLTKRQINAFKSASAEAGKAVNHIGETFDEKRNDLENRTEYAINSMQNVITALNKEIEKLSTFMQLTQSKNNDLKNIAETLVERIDTVSGQLALKTDSLKDKAVDIIDKFTSANDIISKSTEKLNSSTYALIKNEKDSIRVLEEQNLHITNALNNIDLVKEKLDNLNNNIEKSSQDIVNKLSSYNQQIEHYEDIKKTYLKVEKPKQELNIDKLNLIRQNLIEHIQHFNIRLDKLYANIDMFDLWNDYLEGKSSAFLEILNTKLLDKQIMAIRKAFDDNSTFHNNVINYLFLMDLFFKEVLDSNYGNQNEMINIAVQNSFDKLYFVLIKALNNAE